MRYPAIIDFLQNSFGEFWCACVFNTRTSKTKGSARSLILILALLAALPSCAPASDVESGTESSLTTTQRQLYTTQDTTQNKESEFSFNTDTYGTDSGTVKTTSGTTAATTAAGRQTVRVTIPEGYTISQIAGLFETKGICGRAEFIKAATETDFSVYYPYVSNIPSGSGRCFRLEGYLFPSTYEYYTKMDAVDAVGKLLRGSLNNIIGKYSHPTLSFDEILTLASIIEKETGSVAEMAKISSVFHNRLKKGMKLQSDATINYMEMYVMPILTGDKKRYNGYYNTYKCAALPAGPICNPGINAIKAAINPASTDYLYFLSDPETGKYYYSLTYEEHLQLCNDFGLVSPETT